MLPSIDLTLRRLSAEDVPFVAEFEREIATLSFQEDPVTDLGFYERKLNHAIDDRKSWPLVAEAAGKIVGWAWIARRENFVTHELYADLRSFYVVRNKRGAGTAFALMRAVIALCRDEGMRRIVGRTADANRAMQALYEFYAFEPRHIVYELKVTDAKPKPRLQPPRPTAP